MNLSYARVMVSIFGGAFHSLTSSMALREAIWRGTASAGGEAETTRGTSKMRKCNECCRSMEAFDFLDFFLVAFQVC